MATGVTYFGRRPLGRWHRVFRRPASETLQKTGHSGDVREPHQFRTRNVLDKATRTQSISNENSTKSIKPTLILPLITVWLQVRVLPGPPMRSNTYNQHHTLQKSAATVTATDTCRVCSGTMLAEPS